VSGKTELVRAGDSDLRQPQIPALTGLRFFAAAFILVEHAATWLAQFTNSDVNKYFAVLGVYGMPLFFVLSGFVIHYNYRRLFTSGSIARATCEFAAARFARLAPLYFCLLFVSFFADNLIAKAHGDLALMARIVAYYVTLTQSWWYVVYDNKLLINWIFGLSWSISTEMFFYAAFVAVVFIILLIRRANTAILAAISYALVVMCILAVSAHYLDVIFSMGRRYIPNYIPPDRLVDSFYFWLFYFSPYVAVFEFFMGCAAANVIMLIKHRTVSSFEGRLASIALAVTMLFLVAVYFQRLGAIHLGGIDVYLYHLDNNFMCAPAFAFVMFYVSRYDSRLSRALSLPIIIALGDMSYSVYLLHTWTFSVFFHHPVELNLLWGIDAILRIAAAIGLTTVTAYATYRLIEVPSRGWLRLRLGALINAIFGNPEDLVHVGNACAKQIQANRWKWECGTPGRLGFAAASIVLLAAVAFCGEAVQSPAVWGELHYIWDGPEIKIISATYGINCRNYPERAPYTNTAFVGNATEGMRRSCDYRSRCTLPVDFQIAGDPANGCPKDFSVAYRCVGAAGSRVPVKWLHLPAEAFGKVLELQCLR